MENDINIQATETITIQSQNTSNSIPVTLPQSNATNTQTLIATSTLQPQKEAPQESLLLEYGVDIFLVICFVVVYFIKPDPELSLEKQKDEEQPNELEKVLVTEPDEYEEKKESK